MNNFNTILSNNKKKNYLTFSDFPIFKEYYRSCDNLTNKLKIDNIYQQEKQIYEGRISLENLGEEILNTNNDKLITTLQLESNLLIKEKKKLKETLRKKNSLTNLNVLLKKKKISSKSVNLSSKKTKQSNNKNSTKKIKNNIKVKNINKFINKPNFDKSQTLNSNNSKKKYARSISINNTNKYKINLRNTNYRFPKNLTNIDKVYIEYQNIFGQNFERIEHTYLNMTELDKKNCIYSLLNYISDLKKSHKEIKEKNEFLKKENEKNEKKIKEVNNQINKLSRNNKKSINLSTEESHNNNKYLFSENNTQSNYVKKRRKASSLQGSKILSSKKNKFKK